MISLASHIHSDWSYDGKWSLPQLAAVFKARGYQALLMTEHDLGFNEERLAAYRAACAQASSETFRVLPGVEYSEASNTVHILTWGPVPFLGEKVPTGELLKRIKAAHGLAVMAHPSRKEAWKRFDPAWGEDLLGIEVWNRKTDGWSPSRHAPPLVRDGKLQPFVGLDFHDDRQRFPLAMELEKSLPLSEEQIIECLAAGQAQPTAFGRPFRSLRHAPVAAGLRLAESGRRSLALLYRRMKQ